MDNMAYLQQIAGVNNSANSNAKKDNPLAKLLNVWVFVGLGALIVVIIAIMLIVSALNKVDTKDQDLMVQSYWRASYLIDETLNEYADEVKNSDIRNMTASFRSVMNEIMLNDAKFLLEVYGIEVEDLDEEIDPIVSEELNENTELNKRLEDARLNGILDRVYLREITMQVAYLRSFQSEIAERTTYPDVQEFSVKADGNLGNLYEQFHNFTSLTI